ncbi:MAG: DUF2238 domain-containing protein, partial [Xanthomonadales bacterium]|nr:DUF2238 domain-containing protein [Xanthomonadales bacterium]
MSSRPLTTLDARQGLVLASAVAAVLLWSAIGPTDRLTWLMEVIWVLIGVPLLMLSWKRFPLTRLLYVLIALHCVLLIVGGHYTYAKVP